MDATPLHDVLQFLTKPAWYTVAFWLVLMASMTVAIWVWRHDSNQRTARGLAIWTLRVLTGAMWWQQTLWKIPPNYEGLRYWMEQQVAHASLMLQSMFVRDIVLPNLGVFGPLVYLIELSIAVSLLLGFCSRAGALLGALMGLNLWLGLYSAPGEWPWTYMFLIIIQFLFVVDPPGRMLGADTLVRLRAQTNRRIVLALGLAT